MRPPLPSAPSWPTGGRGPSLRAVWSASTGPRSAPPPGVMHLGKSSAGLFCPFLSRRRCAWQSEPCSVPALVNPCADTTAVIRKEGGGWVCFSIASGPMAVRHRNGQLFLDVCLFGAKGQPSEPPGHNLSDCRQNQDRWLGPICAHGQASVCRGRAIFGHFFMRLQSM